TGQIIMTPQQIRKLQTRLNSRHVRERQINGTVIHYLVGWHVIAEANRIFGFDGWDRETVDVSCVYSKANGSTYCAAYTSRIRIRVREGIKETIREGSGAGEATASSPGQAHEFALKAAETDATKRALMTFGNPFGLSLYANGNK
ncbi:MAG: Rad52/Rad22 family DNA repair protein, partial [Desulfobulbia bacterium]